MSSLDLSTNVLWHTLSKDVYTYGKLEGSRSGAEAIMEVSEDLESQPLLAGEKVDSNKKKVKGMIFPIIIVFFLAFYFCMRIQVDSCLHKSYKYTV